MWDVGLRNQRVWRQSMKWVGGRERDICVIGEEDKKDRRRRQSIWYGKEKEQVRVYYIHIERESLLVNGHWVYRLDVSRCVRPNQGRTRFYYDLLRYFYGHNNILSVFQQKKKNTTYYHNIFATDKR